jgi:hypothetical protein
MNESMRTFMDKRKKDKPAAPAAGPAKPAPKKECAPGEILTYACGHKIGARYIQGSNCPLCIKRARQARHAQRAAARAHDVATSRHDDQRLPDGAAFAVCYDAARQCWTGTLTIPGLPVFQGTQSGVFRLLHFLDQQYGQLVQQEAPADGRSLHPKEPSR